MNLSERLAPLLDVPGALAAAFLDPQGQAIAQVGDAEAVEVIGAYGSVWLTDVRRAAAQGELGPPAEVSFEFAKGRLVATMVKGSYFVLLVLDRDGVPALARPALDEVGAALAREID